MPTADQIRRSIVEIGEAIRRPGALAERWDARDSESAFWTVSMLLLVNASLGMAAYGMVMQMHDGADAMVAGAVETPLAAGLAWSLSLPALFVGERLLGASVRFRTALLAAAITVSFGGSALLASVPITWFFTLATPWPGARFAINLVVFGGVGFCMRDVFLRVTDVLFDEGPDFYANLWLVLNAVLGFELFALFGLLKF